MKRIYTVKCFKCGKWFRSKDPAELSQILEIHFFIHHPRLYFGDKR
jgi:hypothetical protein